MSFGSKDNHDYHDCHHIQKYAFQSIVKSNELSDLSYLVLKYLDHIMLLSIHQR